MKFRLKHNDLTHAVTWRFDHKRTSTD